MIDKNKQNNRYFNSSKNWWIYDPKWSVINAISENEKVLDVGCSYGDFGVQLKKKNCTVDGIEIYEPAILEAQELLDNIYRVDLNNPGSINELITKKYSAITFMDVLEHCIDPVEVLRAFKNKLTDNGRIYVSVPNIVNLKDRLSILLGNFNYEEYGVMDKTHLRFFTKKTAVEMVSSVFADVKIINNTPRYDFLHNIVDFWPEMFALQFVIEGRK